MHFLTVSISDHVPIYFFPIKKKKKINQNSILNFLFLFFYMSLFPPILRLAYLFFPEQLPKGNREQESW